MCAHAVVTGRSTIGADAVAPIDASVVRRPIAVVLAEIADDDPACLAEVLPERHGCAVIVTGGRGADSADRRGEGGVLRITGPRLLAATTHGAGRTHHSTLAGGWPLRQAAEEAKRVATAGVAGGRSFGAGAGPADVTRAR